MKTLTIVRHAKSSWVNLKFKDHDRPLKERGEQDAIFMGRRIKEAGIRPSLIISSSAKRAWETTKIIAQEIGYPKEFLHRDKEIYNANEEQLINFISQQDIKFNNIMIVGHNPGLTDLSNKLIPGVTSNLPTTGIVSFNIEIHHWDLKKPHKCKLIHHDFPRNR